MFTSIFFIQLACLFRFFFSNYFKTGFILIRKDSLKRQLSSKYYTNIERSKYTVEILLGKYFYVRSVQLYLVFHLFHHFSHFSSIFVNLSFISHFFSLSSSLLFFYYYLLFSVSLLFSCSCSRLSKPGSTNDDSVGLLVVVTVLLGFC